MDPPTPSQHWGPPLRLTSASMPSALHRHSGCALLHCPIPPPARTPDLDASLHVPQAPRVVSRVESALVLWCVLISSTHQSGAVILAVALRSVTAAPPASPHSPRLAGPRTGRCEPWALVMWTQCPPTRPTSAAAASTSAPRRRSATPLDDVAPSLRQLCSAPRRHGRKLDGTARDRAGVPRMGRARRWMLPHTCSSTRTPPRAIRHDLCLAASRSVMFK